MLNKELHICLRKNFTLALAHWGLSHQKQIKIADYTSKRSSSFIPKDGIL
jgi:hypothetical protein